jgi:hypothetical protein
MLPNDRLGKNRLPVCPRGQIADVLEPLPATTAADAGGTDAEASKSGVREREHARVYPNARSSAAAASKMNACGVVESRERRR